LEISASDPFSLAVDSRAMVLTSVSRVLFGMKISFLLFLAVQHYLRAQADTIINSSFQGKEKFHLGK
jgi:hypothetical protein